MLASLSVLLAVLIVHQRFDDPDVGGTSRLARSSGPLAPSQPHLFSYTTNHHAWIPHEWLSQILIYGAYRWADIPT